MRCVLISAVVLTLLACFPASAQPSFDCKQAVTIDERLICSSPEVSALDSQLGRWFREIVRARPALAAEQRRWVTERNKSCGLSRATVMAALDREAATRCLFRAYEDRLALFARAAPQTAPLRPSRMPYVPHLTLNQNDRVCKALETAVLEGFSSFNPSYSVIDRPWTNGEWEFSDRIKNETAPGTDRHGNSLISWRLDLDNAGKQQVLALAWREHSWRGDMHSLIRFPSVDSFEQWKVREESSTEGQGEGLIGRASGSSEEMGFAWGWVVPAVISMDGKYYLVDEGEGWSDSQPVTLYRIPASGKPQPVCTVERVPEDREPWARQGLQAVAELYSLLQSMAGGSTDCGTLQSDRRLALRAEKTWWRVLLRPWAVDEPYNPRPHLDRWLEAWKYTGVWNYRTHARFVAKETEAVESLAGFYRNAFSFKDAEREARRVIDLAVRNHFNFPSDPDPYPYMDVPSKLSKAILAGAPAEQVRPLLPTQGIDNADRYGEPPLFFAVEHAHLIRLLLDAGASPNTANGFGKTALMYAAQFDRAETMAALLAAGAKTDRSTIPTDVCGMNIGIGQRTALHYAAANAGLDAIRLLVQAGADRTAKDSEEHTPLHYLGQNKGLPAQDRDEAMRLLGAQ